MVINNDIDEEEELQVQGYIRKTIMISQEQDAWINERSISLSKFVRNMIQKAKENKLIIK